MGKLLLAAFADEYDDDFSKQLSVIKENNIDMLELRFADKINVSDFSNEKIKQVKEKLQNSDVRLSAIGAPLGKINLCDDFEAHLEKAKRTFFIAEELGVRNIRVFSFYLRDGQTRKDARGEVIDKLGKLLRASEDFDVVLCHENEAKIYGESPEMCLDILNEFDGKLKCVFDAGNFVLDGYEPFPYAYDMLKEHIEYFHIKDSLYKGAIVPAGKGEAKIAELLESVIKGFDRDFIITLEPHLETFGGLNQLVGKEFDNPYKYENQQMAFLDGLEKLKDILNIIN